MSLSTDAMYNSESRYLHKMYRIYFTTTNVLEVVKSNYLISSKILEETSKISEKPFGDVTSNELELSLLNEGGIFNPKNASGPYYGLIRSGMKIEAFIRPDEVDEWDQIGTFYVTDWSTSSSGMSAEIVANDALYNVLNAQVPSIKIMRNVALSDFLTEYFALFNKEVDIDPSIELILPYAFTNGYSNNRSLLTDLMIAAIADCYCMHDGRIAVRRRVSNKPLRATLTDDDQIISIAIKQSISTDYDSASVTCNSMQESAEQELLSISSVDISPGINTTEPTAFSADRVLCIKSIRAEGLSAKPISFEATPGSIIISLQSTASEKIAVRVIGTCLETVASMVSTDGTTNVSLDSSFVQTLNNANNVLLYADWYVNESLVNLEVTLRGNPKLELGSKVRIISTKYQLDYTGSLVKAQYKYDGGLSCVATFMADMEV